MLRYRQVHDFWHVLSGLPPTVMVEIALKWLELGQTRLPMTMLSSVFGQLRLNSGTIQYDFWATIDGAHSLPLCVRCVLSSGATIASNCIYSLGGTKCQQREVATVLPVRRQPQQVRLRVNLVQTPIPEDRKRVVKGKRVSVRVELGD